MKRLPFLVAALIVIGFTTDQTLSAAGEALRIIDPAFSNIPIQCSEGYAYQAQSSGTCASNTPSQAFNGTLGIGWGFGTSSGLTRSGTAFDLPSFSGLPFSQAAFLQGPEAVGSGFYQTIFGFVAGQPYRLFFYLGSRYAEGMGNQTVVALIDDRVIGRWSLVSYTPFILEVVPFEVATNGPTLSDIRGHSLVER